MTFCADSVVGRETVYFEKKTFYFNMLSNSAGIHKWKVWDNVFKEGSGSICLGRWWVVVNCHENESIWTFLG